VAEESRPEDEDQWLLKVALHSKNNLAIWGHRSDFGLLYGITVPSAIPLENTVLRSFSSEGEKLVL